MATPPPRFFPAFDVKRNCITPRYLYVDHTEYLLVAKVELPKTYIIRVFCWLSLTRMLGG